MWTVVHGRKVVIPAFILFFAISFISRVGVRRRRYTVVGYLGKGNLSYGQAMVACFLEGWLFLLLSLLGVRSFLIRLVGKWGTA